MMQIEKHTVRTSKQSYQFRRVTLFGENPPNSTLGVHLYVIHDGLRPTPVLLSSGPLRPVVKHEESSWPLALGHGANAVFTLECDDLECCQDIIDDIQGSTGLPVSLGGK